MLTVGVERNLMITWIPSAPTRAGRCSRHSMTTCWVPSPECKMNAIYANFTFSYHGLTSHTNLKLTKVNTYGLYYEWKGTDESLKPLLLAAHQGECPKECLGVIIQFAVHRHSRCGPCRSYDRRPMDAPSLFRILRWSVLNDVSWPTLILSPCLHR